MPPDPDLPPAETGDDTGALLGLALVYQQAQYRLDDAARAASRDLFLRMRPITDADLGLWEAGWDTILAGAAAAQARTTESYISASLGMMGTVSPPVTTVTVPPSAVGRAVQWLGNTGAANAPDLASEVEDVLRSLEQGRAAIDDAFRLDRIKWLHSPVIETRSLVGDGVESAWEEAARGLGPKVDAHLRAVERAVMSDRRWPTFKDGTPMAYFRVPQAGACGWCRVVATRMYSVRTGSAGTKWHHGCRCVWRLATEGEYREMALRYGGTFRRGRNYYEAAKEAGLWTGDTTPGAYRDVIGERFDPKAAAEAGYVAYRITDQGIKTFDASTGKFTY